MSFFEKFRKNRESQPGNNAEQWNAVDDSPNEVNIVPDERQQRKIVAFFNGVMDAAGLPDADISSSEKQDFCERLANGEISLEDKKQLLNSIAGPEHQYGAGAVYTGLAQGKNGQLRRIRCIEGNEHLQKMTSLFIGRGFQRGAEVGASGVAEFWRRYETPIDFESDAEQFLEDIRQNNSPAKYREYQRDMRELKLVMFGKRQEYWEQLQLLEQEARENHTVHRMGEMAMMAGEIERTIKASSVAEVSKSQVIQGMLSTEMLEDNGTSQDSSLMLPEKGIFGVFDGVGGSADGRIASSTAAQTVAELSSRMDVNDASDLCAMLNQANIAIENATASGASTGTLVKIVESEEGKLMMWASVGDSRVYVVDSQSQARQISKDEGFGNKITNFLGGRMHGRIEKDIAKQAGAVYLNEGDRVVLCSDGITGDVGEDLMYEEELGGIVGGAQTVEQAAARLVQGARKRDDRTAIVVEV